MRVKHVECALSHFIDLLIDGGDGLFLKEERWGVVVANQRHILTDAKSTGVDRLNRADRHHHIAGQNAIDPAIEELMRASKTGLARITAKINVGGRNPQFALDRRDRFEALPACRRILWPGKVSYRRPGFRLSIRRASFIAGSGSEVTDGTALWVTVRSAATMGVPCSVMAVIC